MICSPTERGHNEHHSGSVLCFIVPEFLAQRIDNTADGLDVLDQQPVRKHVHQRRASPIQRRFSKAIVLRMGGAP